jgi:hypothetical protein
MKTAQQQGTPSGDSGQIFEQKNIAAPPPAAGGGALAGRRALWQFLLARFTCRFWAPAGSGTVLKMPT